MLEARYKKSPAELEMIAIAAYLSTWGMEALIRSIDPGMRETECAAVAEYVMKYMGADRFGFTTMVNSGLRASNVLGRASNKVIEEGDLVVLGTSARYEGMTAALGRTIVAGGKGNPDKFELIEHCIEANGLSRKGYGFGKPAKEADSAAKEYLKGVGLQSMYSTVHGVGWTECVEGTGEATQHSTYTFAKGIASQIDVGVFGVPFKSLSAKEIGARVEDPFFIDHEGRARRLTSLPANVDHLVFKT
jgi:Xaa-Pro aminopeptidase